MQIDEVSLVDKAANKCVFSFVKRDEPMTDADKAKLEQEMRAKLEAEIKPKIEAEIKAKLEAERITAEAKEAERKAAEIKAAEEAAAKALAEKELQEAKELEELIGLAVQANELIEKV